MEFKRAVFGEKLELELGLIFSFMTLVEHRDVH